MFGLHPSAPTRPEDYSAGRDGRPLRNTRVRPPRAHAQAARAAGRRRPARGVRHVTPDPWVPEPALVLSDVSPAAAWRGQLKVRVRASKTNPEAASEDHRLLVGSFAAAVAAVAALRETAAPGAAGRVVPLSPAQINRRIQRLADLAGLDGVSSHSGRRGLAAELVRRGESTTAVQQAGGWQSPHMVARYASAIAVEDGAVARCFDAGG